MYDTLLCAQPSTASHGKDARQYETDLEHAHSGSVLDKACNATLTTQGAGGWGGGRGGGWWGGRGEVATEGRRGQGLSLKLWWQSISNMVQLFGSCSCCLL